jgi:hypothetical protein
MGYFLLQPLFQPGDLLCSSGIEALDIGLTSYIRRQQAGDWGDLCSEDPDANRRAPVSNAAILSNCHLTTRDGTGETIRLMTECDRSYTVLFILGESFEMPAGE